MLAAACVLGVRLLEDYLIMPKVLGEAVGLSPLLVLVSVTAVGILFSGWAVLFAVPIAAVVMTLFDVDPARRRPGRGGGTGGDLLAQGRHGPETATRAEISHSRQSARDDCRAAP